MIEKLTFKVVNSAQNCNTGRVFLTPMLKNNTNCQCFQNSLADSPLTTVHYSIHKCVNAKGRGKECWGSTDVRSVAICEQTNWAFMGAKFAQEQLCM